MSKYFNIGNNSDVIIENCNENFMDNIHITCGNNCKVHLHGINALNSALVIFMLDDAILDIGPKQLMNGKVEIFLHEKSKIQIGENCLWATTRIWSSDMHKIYDLDSNIRLNHAEDIIIGDNVWFGEDSLILKGSIILSGCIIAAKSVVTKSTATHKNSVIAGNPARIVKTNVKWEL